MMCHADDAINGDLRIDNIARIACAQSLNCFAPATQVAWLGIMLVSESVQLR